MTTVDKQLWDKLERFGFDSERTQLTFAKRLARENGWSHYYTGRVIEEYKKFIFLCCVSPTPVTPSDTVDQAWHLHLTYTRSYWEDLCENTLGRKIHHNPTKGGTSEQQKFEGCYTSVKELYIQKFSHQPPGDIWQDNKERFSEINFQRVNLNRYWLIPKPGKVMRDTIIHSLQIAGALLCIQAAPGTWFLVIFLIGFVISAIRNRNNGGKGGGSNSADGGPVESSGGFFGLFCDSGCSADSGGNSGCSGCSGCGGCGGD